MTLSESLESYRDGDEKLVTFQTTAERRRLQPKGLGWGKAQVLQFLGQVWSTDHFNAATGRFWGKLHFWVKKDCFNPVFYLATHFTDKNFVFPLIGLLTYNRNCDPDSSSIFFWSPEVNTILKGFVIGRNFKKVMFSLCFLIHAENCKFI